MWRQLCAAFIFLPHVAVGDPLPSSTCSVAIYTSLTQPQPEQSREEHDHCPPGNGPRAFLRYRPPLEAHVDHEMHGQGIATQAQLREIAPTPDQQFNCIHRRDCGFAVRGFGVGALDGAMLLPLGQTGCPPNLELDGNDEKEDMPTVVEAQRHAAMAGPHSDVPQVSYAVFEVPERALLAPGNHTICYATALAVGKKITDELKNTDFHYRAGVLTVGEEMLACDFESPGKSELQHVQGDYTEFVLPCNFRNFRDRFDTDLVWQLATGPSRTAGTGPTGDATAGLGGKGHYVYMDSPGYSAGAVATLVTPPAVYSPGGYCATFSYSMNGADVSSLRAYLHEVAVETYQETRHHREFQMAKPMGLWGSPRWVAVGNKGAGWHQAGFEFKAGAQKTLQLVFEAVAGRSEYGDIALDDVRVMPGRCAPEIRHHMPKTIGFDNQPMVCGEVRLVTGNHAQDKSWFVEGAVSCAGTGYSLNHVKNAAWVPCCVPHFGTYKLVLQDAFGDGWTGSELEFRFFNRVLKFGGGQFQHAGFDKTYDLVVGTVEVVNIDKKSDTKVDVLVRVARPNTYVWCGVLEAGKDGRPLRVDLGPDLLRTYGVRNVEPTTDTNAVVRLEIKAALQPKRQYDLYCHTEAVERDELIHVDDKLQRAEIQASRYRFTTDAKPPVLKLLDSRPQFNAIAIDFQVDESATVWCASLKRKEGEDADPLFGQGGPLEGLLEKQALTPADWARVTSFFDASGSGIEIDEAEHKEDEKYTVEVSGLTANTPYKTYCYAEDNAQPQPNRVPLAQVQSTSFDAQTQEKVPTVTLVKKVTLHRGFRLHVVADAPGVVYCAAAPADYGVPNVREVVDVGASKTVPEPGKEFSLEVKGVEPNTAYSLYCVASLPDGASQGGQQRYTSTADMILGSATAVSYGRYCEELEEGVEIYTLTMQKTPFHPITAEEEMKIRNFILSQPELDLQGVYRITLMPIKEDVYNYYDKNGTFPKRYARVRAGRCIDDVGFYEQLKVGPLDGTLSYERITAPVETECAGYNPQGVFGRRRRLTPAEPLQVERVNAWLREAFGFEHGSEKCKAKMLDMLGMHKLADETTLLSGKGEPHPHHSGCAELGPIIVEEACAGGSRCPDAAHGGRLWVGLKHPAGDPLPVYFLYDLKEHGLDDIPTDGLPGTWVQRMIRERRIPEDFVSIWPANGIHVHGRDFTGLAELLNAIEGGELSHVTLENVRARRLEEKERQRRRLLPDPYQGAPGTAGPLPKRLQRRGGLEHRAHPEHIESQGKRFTITASSTEEEFTIEYAGWKFTIVNDRDTSLRLYNVRFQGVRVAFEMGLMEALAHYSVSERNFFFMDSWYGGLGAAARKVHKGVECPKTALGLFWDGSVCIFEQDEARPYRSHWKSGEIRDAAPQVVLVLRQMLTVSNYDYVTDYRFHLTGMFEGTVSFTGELYAGIEVPWFSARQSDYGVQVTGAMRLAALHNHLAVWKIDFDIGQDDHWKDNSVLLSQVIADPNRPGAHKIKRQWAETEKDAVFRRDDLRQMVYEIVDEKLNIFGNYGGYRLHPGPGLIPQNMDFELYSGPGAWAKYRCFTTLHKYGELDVTLPRDNKYAKRPAVSVDRYIGDDDDIRHGDLVTWVSDGVFHLPVIEDMPQTIPVGNKLGWLAKPANMWLEDPSMDLWNALGGGVDDPGTCAVVRVDIAEAEPSLKGFWEREPLPPPTAENVMSRRARR